MRKYLSLKTMTIIACVVADKIGAMAPGDDLRALYLADTELTEAIAAAEKEPTPRVAKRGRPRKVALTPAPEPQQ